MAVSKYEKKSEEEHREKIIEAKFRNIVVLNTIFSNEFEFRTTICIDEVPIYFEVSSFNECAQLKTYLNQDLKNLCRYLMGCINLLNFICHSRKFYNCHHTKLKLF